MHCVDGRRVAPETSATARTVDSMGDRIPSDAMDESISQDNPLVQFIRSKKITKRVCYKFSPADKTGNVCKCGRQRDATSHSVDINSGQNISSVDDAWTLENNTRRVLTDAFGEMQFAGSVQKTSQYIVADSNSDVKVLVEDLMLGLWNMERPNLLISVTGGAKNFTMKPRLKAVFRQGLIKAAESTGAWIVTGGTHAGVMKHVGEAVRDYTIARGNKKQIIALGVALWGCVNNQECLTNPQGYGLWPAHYRSPDVEERGTSVLDHNHTHFILVDDGKHRKFGGEITMRSKIESFISKMKTVGGKDAAFVPVICLVLEGGPGTLETVRSAIENETPAIIIEGSGRAADILAFAYASSVEMDWGSDKEMILRAEVRNRLVTEFGEKDADKNVESVFQCIKNRDYITIFRLNSAAGTESEIDIAILHALLKVNRDNRVDQLKLALAWNRVDVASDHIFTDDSKWEPGALEDMMYMAIINNRVQFVRLLLENGVSLRDFLTVKRLLKLYNDPVVKECCPVLCEIRKKNPKYLSLKDVGCLIQDFIGEFYEPAYCRPPYCDIVPEDFLDEANASANSANLARFAQMVDRKNAPRPENYQQEVIFDEPARELFLWCVLMHRQELAMCFWEEGKEGIGAALTAQLLAGALIPKEKDWDVVIELQSQVRFYESLSLGVLAECYSSDQLKSTLLVVREMPNFGCSTALQLAVHVDNMNFVAHPVCQNVLTTIWMGCLADENSNFKMFVTTMLPVLAPFVLKYRADDTSNKEPVANDQAALGLSVSRNETTLTLQEVIDWKRRQLQRNDTSSSLTVGQRQLTEGKRPNPFQTYFKNLINFFTVPAVIFYYNSISYLAFLILYGVILLTDFWPTIEVKEIILIVWIFTLFFDEIRQIAMDDASSLSLKLYSYATDVWNILDMVAFTTYFAGLILRFIPPSICGTCFYAARIILAMNYMTFFFRLLHTFSVHPELGPKLVMIGKMLVDLFYFMIILMVFVAAYGISSQVILYPNSPLNIDLAIDVLKYAWWDVFQQFNIDELSGGSCTNQSSTASLKVHDAFTCAADGYETSTCLNKEDMCPAIDWLMPIVLALYALITQVMMMNLLIAMFSNTFSAVQENTNVVWKMQRYHLVKEFYTKPVLVPPFIVLVHVFLLVRYFFRRCNFCIRNYSQFGFRMKYSNKSEEKTLMDWERVNSVEYLRKLDSTLNETMESQVKVTSDRVKTIIVKVDELAETGTMPTTPSSAAATTAVQPFGSVGNESLRLHPLLESRLLSMEGQLKRTLQNVELLVTAMKDRNSRDNDEFSETNARQSRRDRKTEARRKKSEAPKHVVLHHECRNGKYPTSSQTVVRFAVPDRFVPFDVEYPEYRPVEFTDPAVLSNVNADVDLLRMSPRPTLPFNEKDATLNVLRKSYTKSYAVVDGVPQNPMGRTGIKGRGVLRRWGPNHVGLALVTRWKKTASGKELEFVAVSSADSTMTIPEITFPTAERSMFLCLERVFRADSSDDTKSALQLLYAKGAKLVQRYFDDSRNTDNAWIEGVVFNFHDEDDSLTSSLTFRTSGNTDQRMSWHSMTSLHQFVASHRLVLCDLEKKYRTE